jgi:hypothetical protein
MSPSSHDVWDVECDRPIVDGKVWNPRTSQVQEAGRSGYKEDPPSVDVIWHNIIPYSDFKTVRASFPFSVDEVYVEIAQHIKDESYAIVSISASAYSFAIICKSVLTSAEFMELSLGMHRKN